MRTHNYAAGLVERHPVMTGFDAYLAQECHFDNETVDFLSRHSYFAYPRTLWLKLGVDIKHPKGDADVRARQRLDARALSSALSDWVRAKSALNKIVFDLSDVTIFAAQQLSDLFQATIEEKGGGNFYVCAPELASQLPGLRLGKQKQIFNSEKELLAHLGDVPEDRKCVVKLPKNVKLATLEYALRTQASDKKLRDRDAILFDLTKITSLSFEAHCMFSPVIHSLAHSHGILAEVSAEYDLLRSKVVRDITAHGSLHAMRWNLIHTPQALLRRQDILENKSILPMHTFMSDESGQIQKMCFQRMQQMFKHHYLWTTDIARVRSSELAGLHAAAAEAKSAGLKAAQIEEIAWELWDIIHELVDNVVGHSGGLGYVMLELDPQPEEGLNMYVGDTGIGLARGLEHSYEMQKVTDSAAASMAMRLAEKLDKRRQLAGSLKQGGRGLEHVKILLKRHSGMIRIRTGDAAAVFSLRKRLPLQVEHALFNLQGTHIQVKIPSKWKAL